MCMLPVLCNIYQSHVCGYSLCVACINSAYFVVPVISVVVLPAL